MKYLKCAILVACLAGPALAEMSVQDAYARANTPRAGAAYVVLENTGNAADRLIDVRSDAAARVELHRHEMTTDGLMQMRHVEEGIEIPAGDTLKMARGGDHVMFMGLAAPWETGDTIPVVLIFEDAGELAIEIPVDLDRKP